MRETPGGYFRQTIRLPRTLTGQQVIEALRRVADRFEGQTFHAAERHREGLCYAIGTTHSLGIAEILLLNTYDWIDNQLWYANNLYDTVIVCDAVWNEGFQGEPLPARKFWPASVVNSVCLHFTELLEQELLAVCETQATTN